MASMDGTDVANQDVAFFEGTTSGKLTSRLSSDVNAMVSFPLLHDYKNTCV